MSNFDEDNLIARSSIEKHRISKYEFRPIVADSSDAKGAPKDSAPAESKIDMPISDNSALGAGTLNAGISANDTIEKELIEKLLQKTDELSSSLAKLQIQFEKQQLEMEERINTARNDAYKDGLREGEEKTRAALESDVQKEKTALIDSAINLGKVMKDSETHLRELEKELSAIAVDIAREVIAKEVEKDSAAIATALAKELLGSIADHTDVHLRVNNLDYPSVQEALKDYPKIKIEADSAVTKGGVIIANGGGIIDGSISNRYKTLKQSVLDNLLD
ncbi:hypothetical protein BKN38_05645 [Helicobacter sp. CLO-3]|nr:hypothetical protein BA723_03300 [Helicobacter sp. CLO-3]OHU83192.1 hypothetical protein BKN38_05645 [Helicobacter sp. CLO-3]